MELNELKQFLKDKGAVEIDVVISSVNEKEGVTDELIDELIETYNPEKFEVPNVIGHPPFKDNVPAYGWVKKLYRKGKDLIERATLFPELVEMIKRGAFKKRSIAWYLPKHPSNPYPGKNTLAHVGWLGAVAPAIKNMPNVKLSENTDDLKIVEFSEKKKEENLKKEKDRMEEKEKNDMIFTQENLDSILKTKLSEAETELKTKHESETTVLSDEKKELDKEIKTLKEDIETKDKEIKVFTEKGYEHEVDKIMLSELKLKIAPANREKVSTSLLKIRKLSEEDFKDQVEIYKSQPDVIELGEIEAAKGESDKKRLSEKEKKVEEGTISIMDAIEYADEGGGK